MVIMHQEYVLKRVLESKGVDCVFGREGKNEFGEPDGMEEVLKCKGLYHESGGYLDITLTESGRVCTNKQPMVLVAFTNVVKSGDIILVNNTEYKVTGTDNLGNMNLCLDVSLEVV